MSNFLGAVHPVGAGVSRRRTAANTGGAGASHRGGFFAGAPAPTGPHRAYELDSAARRAV
ncbi:hypothetical protein GEV39_23925 [Pseudomonas sp. NY5710]|nr:hypothetical protein GEV39_23925 [Pseudomonas sp. NY5710]